MEVRMSNKVVFAALAGAIMSSNIASAATVAFSDPAVLGDAAKIIDMETGSTAVPTSADFVLGAGRSLLDPRLLPGVSGNFDFSHRAGLFGAEYLSNVSGTFISIDFTDPVQAAGAWIGALQVAQASNILFAAFDINGNMLDEERLAAPTAPSNVFFAGFLSTDGIARLEWVDAAAVDSDTVSGFIAIDNITYSPSPVPLPATVWLLLSGSGVLGIAGRKKSKNVAV
jgi:hypothetical protein